MAIACAFLLLTPAASRWSSGEAVIAYCLIFVSFGCFTMAVAGQPFPPRLSTLNLGRSKAQPVASAGTTVIPDKTTMLRPLLRKVRAELVTHRDEINRVMVRNRTEGLLTVFWAGTNNAREQIAALATKPLVYPAISDAYGEVIRFAGEIDSSRIGGGPIYETDAIERTAMSVYAAIIRIDSWLEAH